METKALIFDSIYDAYRGVVIYVRVFSGRIAAGDTVHLLATGKAITVGEVGYFRPAYEPAAALEDGEIGYIVTGLKNVRDARVGDTVWAYTGPASGKIAVADAVPLAGYQTVTPFVFAGLFPSEADDYPALRVSLEKLSLSDAALVFEPEVSPAMGNGFRCGFLGLLHMDVVQERLERDYDQDLVITAPSVSYKLITTDGKETIISAPSALPDPNEITSLAEPFVKMSVFTPTDYVGAVMELSLSRRGLMRNMQYVSETRVDITFDIPLAEIVTDFYDKLKSITSGYASMAYEWSEYREGDLKRVDILIGGDKIDALSFICHRDSAQQQGNRVVEKLKDLIPRQQFAIALQAAIGGKIIARETIAAYRKDVTGYLYGGDVSRKKKLLEKQKKGKKRMKSLGKVDIPQEAFMALLQRE